MAANVLLKIAEKFVAQGVLSKEKLESAKRQALDSGRRLDRVLLEEGLVSEEDLLKATSWKAIRMKTSPGWKSKSRKTFWTWPTRRQSSAWSTP